MSRPSSPRVYSAFDPPGDPGIDFSNSPSLTKQAFAEECDVNSILAKFGVDGLAESYASAVHRYLDVSSVSDYHLAQNILLAAQEAFEALPPKARAKFKTPEELLVFLEDKNNFEEARELGLLEEGREAPPPAAGPSGSPRAAGGVSTPPQGKSSPDAPEGAQDGGKKGA